MVYAEIFVVCNFHGQATDQDFTDILEYPRMKQVFSYKYMLGCKFSLTKFSLLIDHPRKLQKFRVYGSGYQRGWQRHLCLTL